MEISEILQRVKEGTLSPAEAEGLLRRQPFEDISCAKLDLHRRVRSGYPEVIFAQGKADEHLLAIFARLYEAEGEVLATRVSPHQAELVQAQFPQAVYDKVARLLKIVPEKELTGLIAVCTAGTADIAVAEEAAQTAEFFGNRVARLYDVGVSGLHRLLAHVDTIQQANCVIAVAGMEGALGSVLAGLVANPVIAVPTSIGYGANFHGLSALLSMLNSCANGIATVNIDNGFGAGYMASQINRLGVKK